MSNAGDFAVSQAAQLKSALDAVAGDEFVMGDHHFSLQVLANVTEDGANASGERRLKVLQSLDTLGSGVAAVRLIDTPGLPEFRGPTLAALTAVETCAVVVNGHNGVEYGTQRLMDYAKGRGLCRLLIVNKIDGANPRALLEQLREAFGPECLPINLPAQGGKAVVDCFFQPEGVADVGSVAEAPQRISAQVVEINTSADVVVFGSTVTVTDEQSGKAQTWTLVGPTEANVAEGKLSSESPVARALLGAKPGDTVKIETPKGTRKIKVEKLGG